VLFRAATTTAVVGICAELELSLRTAGPGLAGFAGSASPTPALRAGAPVGGGAAPERAFAVRGRGKVGAQVIGRGRGCRGAGRSAAALAAAKPVWGVTPIILVILVLVVADN
jgi:hypothetical protein